jgi:hypothetical protein
MEKFKKVDVLEVKRCFVTSQLVRRKKFRSFFILLTHFLFRKGFLKEISLEDFNKRLKKAKEIVIEMKDKDLDKIIKREYKKRLLSYNNCDWYLGEVSPNEMGVWRRAGYLPLEWTHGSLSETAEKVEHALNINSKRLVNRSKYTIQNILKTNVHHLQNEKYLFPIIFKGGTGTKGRKKLKKQMKYDIDDGCMRSIALTIAGVKKIKAYIGFPKK